MAESTEMDPAFKNAGESLGFTMWRVENKTLVLLQENVPSLGSHFYTGDSYLILNTFTTTTRGIKHAYHLHFWLGAETSQDESGIVAYKAVKLDTQLSGAATQFRETQGKESIQFQSYFKGRGLVYQPGGVASGFHHVDAEADHPPQLLALTTPVHASRSAMVRVLPVPLSITSLNHDDAFVLSTFQTLYLFNGTSASRAEKHRALDICRHLRDDAALSSATTRAKIVLLDDTSLEEALPFWTLLGGSVDDIAEKASVTHDIDAEFSTKVFVQTSSREQDQEEQEDQDQETCLFKDVTPLEGTFLTTALLNTTQVLLVETSSRLYVWVGAHVTPAQRREAMSWATSYCLLPSTSTCDLHTPITRVVQYSEPLLFQALFHPWTTTSHTPSFAAKHFSQADTDTRQALTSATEAKRSVEAASYHKSEEDNHEEDSHTAPDQLMAEAQGTKGELYVYRIHQFEKEVVKADTMGQFYSGDSYIVDYHYTSAARQVRRRILYFWQGRDSSVDEQGAAALLTVELDAGSAAIQVRVMQGAEPIHFRALFAGRMIVHTGGYDGWHSRQEEGHENHKEQENHKDNPKTVALYHVKGSDVSNVSAVQVTAHAAALNSGDVFILDSHPFQGASDSVVYLWQGRLASHLEVKVATTLAMTQLQRDALNEDTKSLVCVIEGQEPEPFWSMLGGKAPYETLLSEDHSASNSASLNDGNVSGDRLLSPPRLFEGSNLSGHFTVTEILQFNQTDLAIDAIYVLDTGSAVMCWYGTDANTTEVSQGMDFATEYLASAPTDQNRHRNGRNTTVMTFTTGNEPLWFTSHFHGWDDTFFTTPAFKDPYATKCAALAAEQATAQVEWEAQETLAHAATAKNMKQVAAQEEAEAVEEASKVQAEEEAAAIVQAQAEEEAAKVLAQAEEAAKVQAEEEATVQALAEEEAAKVLTQAEEAANVVKAEADKPVTQVSTTDNDNDNIQVLYSYQDLKSGNFSSTIAVEKKEQYLSATEFHIVFGMSQESFLALPKWKQVSQKKQFGLF